MSRGVALPHQPDPDAIFGDPPVTLYATEDFFISALYWLDGTTDIHEHRFSGAFRVLVGSSIHAVYDFEEDHAAAPWLRVGRLRLRHAEYLRRGEVRAIASGHGLIHSLFHLDRPSVSVVIRTYHDAPDPQLSYEAPGLAYDPLIAHLGRRRQMQALRSMAEWDAGGALRAACALVDEGPDVAWMAVRTWFSSGNEAAVPTLLDAVRQSHGATLAGYMEAAHRERRRQLAIVNRRRMVRSAEHRLFLAMLLNLPDWSTICRIVASAVTDAPAPVVISRWLTELASPELRGASGLHLTPEELRQLTRSVEDGSGTQLAALAEKVRNYQLLDSLLR